MTDDDAVQLMRLPAFRRYLWTLIQSAGMFSATNGHQGRDLQFLEGRRSLGFEALQLAERSVPAQLRTAQSILTMTALLREAAQPQPDPKPKRQTNDRYSDDNDD